VGVTIILLLVAAAAQIVPLVGVSKKEQGDYRNRVAAMIGILCLAAIGLREQWIKARPDCRLNAMLWERCRAMAFIL
jgi:hypothetical protein